MLNFKVKIDQATAHDSYSAWREQDHDDLLLAVALAAWYGERLKPRRPFLAPPLACFNVGPAPSDNTSSSEPFFRVTFDQKAQLEKKARERAAR